MIKFALLAPVLLLVMGSAADYGLVRIQKGKLQAAADVGSLAAAKELGLADFRGDNVDAIVKAVIDRYLATNHADAYDDGQLEIDSVIRQDPLEVDVTVSQSIESPWGKPFGFGIDRITAHSVARVVGRPNICVLGLDTSEGGTISLEQHALVTANDCAVFSNSDHSTSIKSKNSASMTASLICTRGGKSGGPGSFSPDVITDCPGFDDPLADRPEPAVEACSDFALTLGATTTTLRPGTYCDGLTITSGSNVHLEPGIYVIKDGALLVDGGSSLSGEDVGFFFTGVGARFEFAAESSIALSAAKEGSMAGLLFFESRSQPTDNSHRIQSNDARTLLGTIYLSRGELRVDASSPVADQSAYTAIVARTMRLYGGPHLVLNTNYDLTPVPVPKGIRGADQPVMLVK